MSASHVVDLTFSSDDDATPAPWLQGPPQPVEAIEAEAIAATSTPRDVRYPESRRTRQERSRVAALNKPAAAPWEQHPVDQPPINPPLQPKAKRPRLTAEEKEAAAVRKQADAAARKQAREYNSAAHVLRYLTVLVDPELMTNPLGLKIIEAFQRIRQKSDDEKTHIKYRVAPTGLPGFPAIKWLRKIPREYSADAPLSSIGEQGGGGGAELQFIEKEEEHVMFCFEPEHFIARVEADELRSMFALLSEACPGHRPHILVHRLEPYLIKKEREDYKRSLKASGPGGAGGSSTGFRRRVIDDFLARLLVECPQVGFRDVSLAEEGAHHVCCLTRAIAQQWTIGNSETATFLTSRAASKQAKGPLDSLLAIHPVNNAATETVIRALCALPCVGPQIAHAVATRYGSYGALMEMCFDPNTSTAQKIKDLENMQRTGRERTTRVGPKAAKQILEILTTDNPDGAVYGGGDES